MTYNQRFNKIPINFYREDIINDIQLWTTIKLWQGTNYADQYVLIRAENSALIKYNEFELKDLSS